MKLIKLGDFAEYERAKKDVIYEAGTVAIQVSATQGEVIYLKDPQEIEAKYVIIKQSKMIPKYLEYVLNINKKEFMAKYKSGLNIQVNDLDFFEVWFIPMEEQKKLVKMILHIEEEQEIVKKEIENYKNLKSKLLDDMFI